MKIHRPPEDWKLAAYKPYRSTPRPITARDLLQRVCVALAAFGLMALVGLAFLDGQVDAGMRLATHGVAVLTWIGGAVLLWVQPSAGEADRSGELEIWLTDWLINQPLKLIRAEPWRISTWSALVCRFLMPLSSVPASCRLDECTPASPA